jgi:hypothetical protein
VQFAAALACAVGVFAVGRRVGLRRNEAAFGGLLFLTLPIVLLQSGGAKNDLVLASFLVAAAVFVLGDTRGEIALAGLATALAVGTKSTATYGVAVLVVLALVALPRSKRTIRVAGVLAGAVLGAYWYVVNAVDSGRLLGDQSAQQHVTAPFHPAENLLTAYGTMIDTLDVSGARGKDILLYAAAAVLAAAGITLTRRGGSTWRGALVATAIVASPLVVFELSDHLRGSFVHLYNALGKPYGYLAIGDDVTSSPTDASDTASWFGPIGLLLVFGTLVLGLRAYRRRSLPGIAAILALAPFAWFVLVAVTLTYNPWLGRFFIFPVALSAALWGRVLGTTALRWAAATLASLTAFLALVHFVEKPSGLRLLDRAHTDSVWEMDRWQVQSLHDPAVGQVFRFLDDSVPRKTTVALALADNGFGFPVFGPHLQRHVEIVPFGSPGDVPAQWLYADANRAGEIDSSCWRAAFRSDAGTVFERTGTCSG